MSNVKSNYPVSALTFNSESSQSTTNEQSTILQAGRKITTCFTALKKKIGDNLNVLDTPTKVTVCASGALTVLSKVLVCMEPTTAIACGVTSWITPLCTKQGRDITKDCIVHFPENATKKWESLKRFFGNPLSRVGLM